MPHNHQLVNLASQPHPSNKQNINFSEGRGPSSSKRKPTMNNSQTKNHNTNGTIQPPTDERIPTTNQQNTPQNTQQTPDPHPTHNLSSKQKPSSSKQIPSHETPLLHSTNMPKPSTPLLHSTNMPTPSTTTPTHLLRSTQYHQQCTTTSPSSSRHTTKMTTHPTHTKNPT